MIPLLEREGNIFRGWGQGSLAPHCSGEAFQGREGPERFLFRLAGTLTPMSNIQRSGNELAAFRTAILVCGDLSLDLKALQERVASVFPEGVFQKLPRLCKRPGALGDFLRRHPAHHVVLGLCHPPSNLGALQTEARKAGVDPLGMEIRVLPSGSEKTAIDHAALLLIAAAARAQRYPGSRPQQIRPHFSRELDRRALLHLSWLFYEGVPWVDRERCAAEQGCRVCQRVCPYEAWRWTDGWPELDKESCQTCGLCLVSCPRGAIVNPRWTPEQLEAEIRTLLDPRIGDLSLRGLVFYCQRADVESIQAHPSWLKVAVPCVGMLPPSWLLAPLVLGAGAVRISPCPGGCAHHLEERWEGIMRFCHRVLAQLGLSEDRIRVGGDLLQSPPEGIGRIEAEGLFLPQEPARVFQLLAEACRCTELSLTDPFSPLGQVYIDPDVCTGCARCAQICPTGALGLEEEALRQRWTFDAVRCVACEECLLTCPERARDAIRIARGVDLQRWHRGRVSIHETEIMRCIRCGQPIATTTMLNWIESRLGEENPMLIRYLKQYCATCRQALASTGGYW